MKQPWGVTASLWITRNRIKDVCIATEWSAVCSCLMPTVIAIIQDTLGCTGRNRLWTKGEWGPDGNKLIVQMMCCAIFPHPNHITHVCNLTLHQPGSAASQQHLAPISTPLRSILTSCPKAFGHKQHMTVLQRQLWDLNGTSWTWGKQMFTEDCHPPKSYGMSWSSGFPYFKRIKKHSYN